MLPALIRKSARAALWGSALLLVTAALFTGLSLVREHRRFDIPFPDIRAGSDSARVARGEYLVRGPGHCADCHAPPEHKAASAAGGIVPLSGGSHLDIYLGRISFPNITPDSATGIGARTDGEIARYFRTGIDHRGEIGLPFMRFAGLSDADLSAVISYLRSLEPVTHVVPQSRYNVLGAITRAWFLEPFAPPASAVPAPVPGRTAEYGRYLVEEVADCASCHTRRNMKTGDYTGPRFAGGMVFRRAGGRETVTSPNLTPDPGTGVMAAWDEAAFIRRFKAGSVREWSPMPWGPFSRIREEDLAAMWMYLRGLAPERKPDPED